MRDNNGAVPKDGNDQRVIEFEVDQNRNGVALDVVLRRDGALAARGMRSTRAPSGSFSFDRRIAGASGDRIAARATRAGETCRGSVTAP